MRKKGGWLIILIFFAGAFCRIYRQGDLLGFYYDQGRDALKVVDILTFKDLPAIGPTTGLSGVFLGPFWFYFIAPFYWLGRGDPAVAAGFVGLIDSFTIILLYLIGKRFFSRKIGFLAALLWGFSYWAIRSARWFSNPSPLPFFTLILLLALGEWLINKKKKWLPVVSFSLAVALQLEAASAVFYLPALLFLVLVFKLKIKEVFKERWFWLAVFIFFLFLLPQLAFEIKNNFLITKNLIGFLTGKVNTDSGKSWALPTKEVMAARLNWYHRALFSLVDPNLNLPPLVFFLVLGGGGGVWWLLKYWKEKRENDFGILMVIFLFTPLFFLLFFVGNYGHLYDYYLTGFFPVFILLFASFLAWFPLGIILVFLGYFFWQNGVLIKNYLSAGVDGPTHITLGNQKQVIEWVCQDAQGRGFNIDVYVPPVIPYAWDYLWQWFGCQELSCCPSKNQEKLLYTIWEIDPSHPERLEDWLERQQGIGKIQKKVKFGGVGVERRERLK